MEEVSSVLVAVRAIEQVARGAPGEQRGLGRLEEEDQAGGGQLEGEQEVQDLTQSSEKSLDTGNNLVKYRSCFCRHIVSTFTPYTAPSVCIYR